MRWNVKRNRGLSLIELIIVFAIISIVTAVSMPYYRDFICQRSVEYWKDMIISDLGRAKYKTMLTEIYWGIETTGESAYIGSYSNNGIDFKEAQKKIRRQMNKDYAGCTKFDAGLDNIYFSPRACIGSSAGSNWAAVGIYKNFVLQNDEFSFTIRSGKFSRTITVSKSGECRSN
jgi:prepilin-type N-terminal cleavage/methylation domain-containing protein